MSIRRTPTLSTPHAGQLLFLEHVRDEDPRIAKKQDIPPFL
jgi:hypothetical protein